MRDDVSRKRTVYLQQCVDGLTQQLSGLSGGGAWRVVDGAAAGDVTVPGISGSSTLTLVLFFPGAGVVVTDVVDLTEEFSTSSGKINNAAGTDTTGGKLLVQWS